MIHEIVRHCSRIPRTVTWLCCKLVCSEKELRAAIASGVRQGFAVQYNGQFVTSRVSIGPGPLVVLGDTKPGRHHIAHITDTHAGSKHFHARGLIRFGQMAWKLGCRTVAGTGDWTDGVKPLLVPDQRFTGSDDQSEELVATWRKLPPFQVASISGNHDGYTSAAAGLDFGRVIEERMRAAGIDWHHAGTCAGNAVLHGARTHMWHPMGAASTPNAIRRMLNARAETLQEPCDLLLSGHLHHFAMCHAHPEDVFCASGGTFQLKRSEFANRISRPWDVGGSIISFTLDRKGRASEFSAKLYPVAQDIPKAFSYARVA